jgi:hypothetical protein
MKIFLKNPILTSLAALAVAIVLGLTGPMSVFAATSPTLTGAASYSVVAGSIVTNVGATTISGNLGVSPSIGVPPHATGFPPGIVTLPSTIHDADGLAALAQADNTAAFGFIDQPCTTTYAGIQDLTLVSPLGPGVYCAGAFTLTGHLALTGTSGVWIFKSAATLITSDGSFVTGGDPCNIWWRVVSSATLGKTSSFIGNILASTAITMNTGATLNGRAMTQTAAITLGGNTISGPVCSAPPGGGNGKGTVTVIKTVINDNGGTKTIADFPLNVSDRQVVSGVTNIFNAPRQYNIFETGDPNYTETFPGDCNVNGTLNLYEGTAKICIITNNDIGAPVATPPVPPLIDVVKVPSPLSLPNGPGPVKYTYTLTNVGTVPVTDITMVGDTCSPIVLASGDTNADNKLDLNETWVYACSTTLTETHTNTVVATGWANGISAIDIASATVIVGKPVVPPLIHITKVPNPLVLPVGGGMVTYTKKVTNPGTVALSNVKVTDDKCSPIKYISGDTNVNLKLEPTETWIYTCQSNLTVTTTNTAVATGEANGITVRDFALATVVVPTAPLRPAAPPVVPKLPKTGVDSGNNSILWTIATLVRLFTFGN